MNSSAIAVWMSHSVTLHVSSKLCRCPSALHSGSNWLKTAINELTWSNNTNFYIADFHIASIYSHSVCFKVKTYQILSGTIMQGVNCEGACVHPHVHCKVARVCVRWACVWPFFGCVKCNCNFALFGVKKAQFGTFFGNKDYFLSFDMVLFYFDTWYASKSAKFALK